MGRDFRRYTINWRGLNNPSLWTRAKARVKRFFAGREPYLRPPSWSAEHSPQTIRKIMEYEQQVCEQILTDRDNVRLFLTGGLIGVCGAVVYLLSGWFWHALFGW